MDTSSWPQYDVVRQPLWKCVVNGTELLPLHAALTTNNHYRSDSFSAEFALNAVPAMQPVWDGATSDIPSVEFHVCFLPPGAPEGSGPWRCLFVGELDEITQSPLKGTVSVTARDLSSRLIDAKTSETFANKRSSDVAAILAARHGLGTDIDPTSALVGSFYQKEHDKITGDGFSKTNTEWDLLVFLARQEGYDVWVGPPANGSGPPLLHFKQAVAAETATPLQLVYTPSGQVPWPGIAVLDIEKKRHTKIAKGTVVTMKVWDSKSKSSTPVSYPSSPSSAQKTGQVIVLPPRPGMSKQRAQQYVQQQYHDIVAHERLVSLEMPVEFTLDARSIVQLSGTQSSYDYRYYVDSISRDFSTSGCRQTVRLKNHVTESDSTV